MKIKHHNNFRQSLRKKKNLAAKHWKETVVDIFDQFKEYAKNNPEKMPAPVESGFMNLDPAEA